MLQVYDLCFLLQYKYSAENNEVVMTTGRAIEDLNLAMGIEFGVKEGECG